MLRPTIANAILKFIHRVFGITRTLLLYRFIQLLFLPLIVLYFAARLMTNREYRSHFGERLGFLPRSFNRTKSASIWLHAVSVGEVISAIPLLKQLRSDRPQIPLYLSTSTVAGRKAAQKNIIGLVDGLFYSPVDYVSCVRRVLKKIRPALLIILETEIWPTLYSETKATGARLAIVNGRISDRTWPRYRKWSALFKPILRLADTVWVQSAEDLKRYLTLGARPDSTYVVSNLKYDAAYSVAPVRFDDFGASHVWIAASTVGPNERGSIQKHEIDEDDIVLETFTKLTTKFPRLLLILAPRQPSRFDLVAQKLASRGLSFLRRSSSRDRAGAQDRHSEALTLPGVLLLDTIGELAGMYPRADVVFVGGSIAPRGGHNIIEPASVGAAIIVGPHMQNFEVIAADFLRSKAILQVKDGTELHSAIEDLLRDQAEARRLGRKARDFVASQMGVSAHLAEGLWSLFYSAFPRSNHGAVARVFLYGLSVLWEYGGYLKRHRSQQTAASLLPLPAPVISIGGITVGGSGKTPFTTYLAKRMSEQGHHPAILTRGYRRRSPAENMVFGPGARIPTAFTGDEAQIFLRANIVPIGIGAKRYETGKILLRQYPDTDVLLLDDGFQHARLHRDIDLVVIDGLDPFGHSELVPLGRLREPLDALGRAHAFIVTRAENDFRFEAISARLKLFNPPAPIFRTRLIARCWRDYRTGEPIKSLTHHRVAAFCGLGNPESFWRTLEALQLEIVYSWSFDDHHHYTPAELRRLAWQARQHGADILVTTEKDRINCPGDLESVIAPLGLAWLEIELELEAEQAFFSFVQKTLQGIKWRNHSRFIVEQRDARSHDAR